MDVYAFEPPLFLAKNSEYSFSLGNCSVPYEIVRNEKGMVKGTTCHEQQMLTEMGETWHVILYCLSRCTVSYEC